MEQKRNESTILKHRKEVYTEYWHADNRVSPADYNIVGNFPRDIGDEKKEGTRRGVPYSLRPITWWRLSDDGIRKLLLHLLSLYAKWCVSLFWFFVFKFTSIKLNVNDIRRKESRNSFAVSGLNNIFIRIGDLNETSNDREIIQSKLGGCRDTQSRWSQ